MKDLQNLQNLQKLNPALKSSEAQVFTGQITIHGLNFKLDSDFGLKIELLQHKTPMELKGNVQKVLKCLKGIDSKGYVNVSNLQQIPVIKDLVGYFTTTHDFLWGVHCIDAFKWIYNLLILSLYDLTLKLKSDSDCQYQLNPSMFTHFGQVNGEIIFDSDSYHDLVTLTKYLYGQLDPSIRKCIQKRGVSVIQNIQCGFDTEYQNLDMNTNKLLSVQAAVNTQSYLKIPSYINFTISKVETLTNKRYDLKLTRVKGFELSLLEQSIQSLILNIRWLKYPGLDNGIIKLVTGLKCLDVIQSYERGDAYYFRFPSSAIKTFITYPNSNSYSLQDLVKVSTSLGQEGVDATFQQINQLLQLIFDGEVIDPQFFEKPFDTSKGIPIEKVELLETTEVFNTDPGLIVEKPKTLTRTFVTNFSTEKMSFSRVVNNVLIGHLTPADLSMLSDFEEFKGKLDIVHKSFVTMGKPFEYHGHNIVIRDTMLLAPGGKKSLSSIGSLYNLNKLELSLDEIKNMSVLLERDKAKFTRYAIRDALITLVHASWMESFHFELQGVGVPLTLSSLGNKFVGLKWSSIGYGGYQLSPEILIGDASLVQTPQGLNDVGPVGLKLGMFIGNYKGGRNESYMYGIDKTTLWYDYDLISAYTTVLSVIGNPEYKNGKSLNPTELSLLTAEDLLFSYTIIKCQFKFPSSVKYPSIPVYADKTTTIYPLQGDGILTGAEYLLARSQKCTFNFEEIYHIPFGVEKPFEDIITEIQEKRREFPKGTISNLMYKEIGNSIYGSIVRGMSNKMRYDNKTGLQKRMGANLLSNPILASWITAFIRSIIGELLHSIAQLGGKVVSATTDGFITNLPNLESLLGNENENVLLKSYKEIRLNLSGNGEALEIKHEGVGIISWTTRGQLGIGSKIKATTGFQTRDFNHSELITLFTKIMGSEDKGLDYIQTSLRTANAIAKRGGQVTMTYRDQRFNLKYDNRRLIIDTTMTAELCDIEIGEGYVGAGIYKDDRLFDKMINGDNLINEKIDNMINDKRDNMDLKYHNLRNELPTVTEIEPALEASLASQFVKVEPAEILYDSKPVSDIISAKQLRFIARLPNKTVYNRISTPQSQNGYKTYTDLAVRNFVKGLVCEPQIFPEIAGSFKDYSSIVDFILKYDAGIKVSEQSISNLKMRKSIFKQVPRNKDTLNFVGYVIKHFPDFNQSLYFNKT